MTLRTALAAGLLLVAAPLVSAQKPVERSPLEIGQDYVEETTAAGADLLVGADGTPRALYRQAYPVRDASPEAMARQYLAENAALLRLASPDLGDLALRAVRSGRAGHVVRFTQTVGGVPVYGPDLVVNVDPQNRVQLVLNTYRAAVAVPTTEPAVVAEAAHARVVEHLNARGAFRHDETALVIYPAEDGARLAWQVRLVAEAPRGEWEAFVDAQTGALLRVADRALYEHGGDHAAPGEGVGEPEPPSLAPTVQNAGALVRVDGTAMVFNPDPLTSTGSTYGGGYVETTGSLSPCFTDPNENPNCDVDTPELTAARVAVTLRDVTFDGTNYRLVGPYAEIREIEPPTRGTFDQPSSDWASTRNPAVFEAANTYFHIDTFMRYVNEDLAIPVMPYHYSGGVRFDAHAFDGVDNSYYSGGAVHFGEGCVDDDEDADVIIHELGHGIHDWVTSGGLSQVTGLSEGTGDYFAASYTRSLGLLDPTDPSYYWVFKWDGHNPCWPGRVTNYAALYPSGLTGSIHTDGQMWSSTLMQIWSDIGGERADAAVLEGLATTNGATNQSQAAAAVMQAATNMGYTYAELLAMYERFSARGYSVTEPPPPTANEPGAEGVLPGLDLTAAYPNPFQSGASFTVRVAEAQHVSVALYDALGRRVRLLYEGPMAPGERRVLTIPAGALPDGLYVYRAVGAVGSASRTVVLSR